jgi:hypothetical protein
LKINKNWLRVNQSFTQGTGGIFKSGRNKLRFYCESFRNKIQPGIIENWSFKLAPTLH